MIIQSGISVFLRNFSWIVILGVPGAFVQAEVDTSLKAEATTAPLLAGGESAMDEELDLRWEIQSAYQALRSGLPLAESLFKDILSSRELPPSLRIEMKLGQVSALIAIEAFDRADEVLDEIGGEIRAGEALNTYLLRRGIVDFQAGAYEEAKASLAGITERELKPSDRAWHLLLKGLIAEHEGRFADGMSLFEESREKSMTKSQRLVAESLIQRNRLLQGEKSESLIRELENLLEENRYSRLAVQYAQELAVSLFKLNEAQRALDVLGEQIRLTLAENRDQLDELHLLSAVIEREIGRTGQGHLEWLIRNGKNREYQKVAIWYLLQEAGDRIEVASLLGFLEEVLLNQRNHPLAAEILFTRALLMQGEEKGEEAKDLFTRLLSEFPGSILASEALRHLGHLSWHSGQYRTAADYFSRLRDNLPAGRDRVEAGVYQADAFFRNGDYETAARAYEAVYADVSDDYLKERILYQWVIAEIRSGRVEQAAGILDKHDLEPVSSRDLRWEAEWNLIDAMRSEDSIRAAYGRIQNLLEASGRDESMPISLQIRFLWLEALLTLDMKRYEAIPEITDNILELLLPAEEAGMDEALVDEITVRTLLVLSQSFLRRAAEASVAAANSDSALSGFEVIDRLEKLYPEHEVTLQALFEKARFLREAGRAVDAQNIYLSIFERSADSVYAPIALYEAAINAANLIALENPDTLNLNNSEPIRLLNQLTENYKKDTRLFFFARLKQGDIARNLGQFGVAQTLYEDVIKSFSEHPKRYLADVGRADSILAQAGDDSSRLGEAIIAYERLFERPSVPLDLRVEAGYKWAFAIASRKNTERSQAVHNLLHTRFLHDVENANKLGPSGRYWMSRSLLSAGELFEREGELRAARTQYETILDYRLPGKALAQAHLKRLGFGSTMAQN